MNLSYRISNQIHPEAHPPKAKQHQSYGSRALIFYISNLQAPSRSTPYFEGLAVTFLKK